MSLKLEFIIAAIDRATKPVSDISKGIDRMLKPAREVRASLNALMGAAGFDRLRGSVRQVGFAFDGLMASARGVAGLVGGVALAAASAFYGFKRVADGVDGINDLAVRLGISTQRLQEMGFAAQMSGSNQEELGQGLMFLNKNLAEARAGSVELRQAFAAVGVTAKDLRDKSFVGADAYERMGDVFMRAAKTGKDSDAMTRYSMMLQGRAGAGQIQALSQGSAKMREYYAEARRLGVVLSTETVKAMTDFNDQFDTARLTLFGAVATALAGIAPRIQKVVEGFTELISKNRELISTGVAEFFERLEKSIPKIAKTSGEMSESFGTLAKIIDAVADAVGGWGNVVYAVAALVSLKLVVSVYALAKALGLLGGSLLLTPLGWFVALAGLGVLIYNNWEPVKKFFADLFPNIAKALDQLPSMSEALSLLSTLGDKVSGAVKFLFPGTMEGQQVSGPLGVPIVHPRTAIAPRAGQGKIEAGGALTITVDDQRARVTKAQKAPGGVLEMDVYNGSSFLSLSGI